MKPADSNADLTILGDPARMATGVNQIDTMTGYPGFNGRRCGRRRSDGVTQDEFLTVPGSLLGKAQMAQTVFDNGFLLPVRARRAGLLPDPGQQPGDRALEPLGHGDAAGDPFFAVASQPVTPDGDAEPAVRSELPQFDVEGYRVYRGRVDNPSELAADRPVRLRAGSR